MMMLPAGVKVHIAAGVTDMRKGMDGLAMLVEAVLREDPFSGRSRFEGFVTPHSIGADGAFHLVAELFAHCNCIGWCSGAVSGFCLNLHTPHINTISASLASVCICLAKKKKAPSVVRMPF